MRFFVLGLCIPGAGCALPSFVKPSCDPRTLEANEVRARQILCTDELVDDGDNHVGDWLIENSHSRFVVRGSYSITRGVVSGAANVVYQPLRAAVAAPAPPVPAPASNGGGYMVVARPGQPGPGGIANFLHIFLAAGNVLRAQTERMAQGLEGRGAPLSSNEWSACRTHG